MSRRKADPPWYWKPWLVPWLAARAWWYRARPVRVRGTHALIKGWQQEIAENRHLNTGYHQGYADALDRCVQALKLLKETA